MTRKKSDRELEQMQQILEYWDTELRVFIADILPADIEIRQQMEDRMIGKYIWMSSYSKTHSK